MQKESADILIIGAGASGMMAAITAARSAPGARVLLLEGGQVPGKKLLMTGNGRCNFTNLRMKGDCFRSRENGAAMKVIRAFSEKDTIRWFGRMGLAVSERDGYLYPRCGQASCVRDMLEEECVCAGVKLMTESKVTAARKAAEAGDFFFVQTEDGRTFQASRLILTTGGKAAPHTGSDGSGYVLAEALGHRILRPVPALVPLTAKEKFCKKWDHIRTRGRITLFVRERKAASSEGELQLAAYGISGIPVFQVSRYASAAVDTGDPVRAELNFLPEWTEDTLEAQMERGADLSLIRFLRGLFPEKLAFLFSELSGIRSDRLIGSLSAGERRRLIEKCCALSLTITGTRGFEMAQVTAGGIPTRELDLATMASRVVPGLYAAGEITDVDGICGGYNLQWAFSSGYLAGFSAAASLKGE